MNRELTLRELERYAPIVLERRIVLPGGESLTVWRRERDV